MKQLYNQQKVKFGVLTLVILLLNSTTFAAQITTAQTGSFSSSSTWTGGVVPTSTDDIVIQDGHTLTISANASVNKLKVNTNGIVNVTGGILTINSDLIVSLGSTFSSTRQVNVFGNSIIDGVVNGGTSSARPFKIMGSYLTGKGQLSSTYVLFDGVNSNNVTIHDTSTIYKTGSVYIASGKSVTNNGSFTITANISAVATTGTWVNASNSYLYIGGGLLISGTQTGGNGNLDASYTGNSIVYTGSNTYIKGGTYYNLFLSGTGTKNSAGNIVVLNNAEINTAFSLAGNATYVGPFSLTIAGNITGSSTTSLTSGTIILNGTSNQSFAALTGCYNLIINKSSGSVTMISNFQVRDSLYLGATYLNMSGNRLILGTNTTTKGRIYRTTGNINGTLRRYLPASWAGVGSGSSTLDFPIGNTTNSYLIKYKFNFINFTSSATYLEVSFSNIVSPSNLSSTIVDGAETIYNVYGDGVWTAVGSSISNTGLDYNITVTPSGFETYAFNGSERVISKTSGATNWSVYGNHTGTSSTSSAQRINIGTISLLHALASTTNFPVPSALKFSDSTLTSCISSSKTFVISSPNAASTYTWNATGSASISGSTSGLNLNTVTVDFGVKGTGVVTVRETDANGVKGPLKTINVTVGNATITSISGTSSSYEGNNSDIFTITNVAGNTYTWSTDNVNSSIVSGQGTSSAVVQFDAAGTMAVQVTVTNSCGNENFSKTVSIASALIASDTTGDFNDPYTFDGFVPNANSNVILDSAATVSVSQTGNIIKSLNIDQDAVLILQQNLTITGNFTNNGVVNLGGKTLTLSGTNTFISGTGQITNGIILVSSGTKTILSTTNLTINNLTVSANITNNGTLTLSGNMNGSSTFTNASGSSLSVTGDVTSPIVASASSNSVSYNGAANQIVRSGTYNNLNISNAGVKTLGGTLTVTGNLTINGSAQLNTDAVNNRAVTIGGNLVLLSSNSTPLEVNNSTVTFNGSASQLVGDGPFSFYHLTVSSNSNLSAGTSGDVTIKGNVSVGATNGSLNFKSGLNILNVFMAGTSTQTMNSANTNLANLTINSGSTVTSSTTLNIAGNFNNLGTFTSTGTLLFNGSSTQTFTGSTSSLKNLTLNKTGDLKLESDLTMTSGRIILTSGSIDLNGKTLTVNSPSSNTTIDNGSNLIKGTTGTVIVNSTLSTNTQTDVGGLGIQIKNCAECGSITITRRHTPQGFVNKSIARAFDITVTNAIVADLIFNYSDTELNGQTEANFKLYKSSDGGLTWSSVNVTADYTNNTVTATNLTSFSRWTASNSITNPVPVNFSSLSINKDGNLTVLNWSTSFEINNQQFVVEKSIDGANFEAVGVVASKGNSNSVTNYNFTLPNQSAEVVFFRIKQIDLDGSFHYSKIVSLSDGNFSDAEFTVFPNPVTDKDVFVQYNNVENETVSVKVIDVEGITHYIEEFEWNGSGVARLYFIEGKRLNKGVYFITIQSASKKQVLKLIVE